MEHVYHRIQRIHSESDPSHEQLKQLLLNRCRAANDALKIAYEATINPSENIVHPLDTYNLPQGSLLDDPNPLIPEVILQEASAENSLCNQEGRGIQSIPTYSQFMDVAGCSLRTPQVRETIPSRTGDVGNNNNDRQDQGPFRPTVRFADDLSSHTVWSQPQSHWPTLGRRSSMTNIPVSAASLPTCSGNRIGDDPSLGFCDVSRWKVQYDGQSSVNNFLERVEELRMSRGISKDRLLRAAPELLTKDALTWYRTQKFQSWDEFEFKLREAYHPYDYEFELMDEIRRRTQGQHEKIVTYIAVMENLFRKLGVSCPPEETRIKMIRRNLLPSIQSPLALHTIDSISSLVRHGKAVEETTKRVQQYAPPPTNYKNLLEPELAYHKNPHSSTNVHTVATVHQRNQRQPDINTTAEPTVVVKPTANSYSTSSPSLPSSPKCWNCSGTGHRFRKCPEPRRRFYYTCGRDNTISHRCPICSKNGKGSQ